jgi:hypothetical protein
MVTWVYLRGGLNIWAAVILHGSQSFFSIFNTNIPTDLVTSYSVISYSLIALMILAVDRRRWFVRPAETTASAPIQAGIPTAD